MLSWSSSYLWARCRGCYTWGLWVQWHDRWHVHCTCCKNPASDLFGDFPKFDKSLFEGYCLENSTPPSLVSFLTTLLGGYNIDSGSPTTSAECTAACSIAQLIQFNSVKHQRPNTSDQPWDTTYSVRWAHAAQRHQQEIAGWQNEQSWTESFL